MKIFVVVRVPRGDAELDGLCDLTSAVIHRAGHDPFVAAKEIVRHGLADPKDFMPFACRHVIDSDLLIVLYHPELRGGLIEVGIAYAHAIPIWLCHKPGERISSSAQGCAERMIEYANLEMLEMQLIDHLRGFGTRNA